MGDESEKMAPTASIETLIVVRPLKVISLLIGFFNIILMISTIGASAWVCIDGVQKGLWEACITTSTNHIDCSVAEAPIYILACRGLCILALSMCFTACIIVACGLKAQRFAARYRCYYIGMLVFFLAVLFNATALIIYPIKYSEEMGERQGSRWSFGWAYGMGWGSTILLVACALMLCLDKDADEIIFRERITSESGIEDEVL